MSDEISNDEKQRRWEEMRKVDTYKDFKDMTTERMLASGIIKAVKVIGEDRNQ